MVISCNLCGNNDFKVISPIGYPFSKRVRNVICTKCGLVYQNPIPDMSHLRKHYKDYRKITIGIETPTKQYEEYSQPMSHYHYSFFKEYCKPSMSILDIGCGAGTLMSWAVKDGLNAYGVNPDAGFAQYGMQNYGLKDVQICLFEDAHFHDNMFDIITLNHVFEHFTDVTAVLSKIRQYLKPDGLLYISTPNNLTPHGQLEFNYFDEHINTFSPTTARLMLKKMGFKIIKTSTFGYLNKSGLHHPYIDLVAQKLDVVVPQTIDWGNEHEDFVKVLEFINNYRESFLKSHGRLKVRLGILNVMIYNLNRSNKFWRYCIIPIRKILGRIAHLEPNYCDYPSQDQFPQEKIEYIK